MKAFPLSCRRSDNCTNAKLRMSIYLENFTCRLHPRVAALEKWKASGRKVPSLLSGSQHDADTKHLKANYKLAYISPVNKRKETRRTRKNSRGILSAGMKKKHICYRRTQYAQSAGRASLILLSSDDITGHVSRGGSEGGEKSAKLPGRRIQSQKPRRW